MELSFGQYHLVYNLFSLTVAVMAGAGIYFLVSARAIDERFRPAMYVSTIIVWIAAYHYFRIFQSWDHAFELVGNGGGLERGGTYVPAAGAEPFNEAYRYADWLVTVPLLIVELYIVLGLKKAERKSGFALLTLLILGSVGMLVTGYIGEIQPLPEGLTPRFIWGTISSVFFVYVLWKLWTDVGARLDDQPGKARVLTRNVRLLLLFTWGFYPIVYCFPFLGWTGETAAVLVQSGYSIADIAAKAGYGLLIHHIAVEKTEALRRGAPTETRTPERPRTQEPVMA